MPSVAVRIDEKLQARLKAIAEAEDRSPHYLMKSAIEDLVERKEREAEELAILKERWAQFEKTGSYVPGEKVRAWVASLPRN